MSFKAVLQHSPTHGGWVDVTMQMSSQYFDAASRFNHQEFKTVRNDRMTTKDIIHDYFDSLKHRRGWEAFLSEEMTHVSYTSPVKRVAGRGAYLTATKRFYSMITSLETKDVVIEGEKAGALTRYELQSPDGVIFESHVAEMFEVREGKIASLANCFDSAPFPKRP